MTHSSFIFVIWLIHMCDVKHVDTFGCLRMRHVTRMVESFHSYEWESCVMSHRWCLGPYNQTSSRYVRVFQNESCHTYGRVMSHIWMSHVTHMNVLWAMSYRWCVAECPQTSSWQSLANESCHTYWWVMSHIWMHIWRSHVTHMDESCHIYKWFTNHVLQMVCDTVSSDKFVTIVGKWVMSHIWLIHKPCPTDGVWHSVVRRVRDNRWQMSHVTYINDSRTMSYRWCVTQYPQTSSWQSLANESCHTYKWFTNHVLQMVCDTVSSDEFVTIVGKWVMSHI